MKQLLPALLLVSFAVLLFGSCAKTVQNPVYPSYISVNFNSSMLKTGNLSAVYSTSQNAIQLKGWAGDSVNVEVVIQNVGQGGIADISSGRASVICTVGPNIYTATSGNITITSFTSKQITGTFQFSASDAALVSTNGNTIESIATATGTNGTFTTSYVSE
jgi:hypothetical protein